MPGRSTWPGWRPRMWCRSVASGKIQVSDVDAMLARWRDGAGADWRATFRGRLEAHGRAFKAKGSPLDAWDVILLARALGEAPPQWAMNYLATCAAGIYDLRAESFAGKSIKPAEIGRALGMVSGGAGTVFPGIDAWGWLALGTQVRDALKAGGGLDFVWENVAEANGISKSKVRDAWKRFEAECPELL